MPLSGGAEGEGECSPRWKPRCLHDRIKIRLEEEEVYLGKKRKQREGKQRESVRQMEMGLVFLNAASNCCVARQCDFLGKNRRRS